MAFSGKPEHLKLKSAQARYAAHAAAACGYAFRSLDGDDGYLFEVTDGTRRGVFGAAAGTPYAVNDARAASISRDKAFCARVLREAGLPVLPGQLFFVTKRWTDMRNPGREIVDALAFAKTAAFPVFCKPVAGSNGLDAEVVEDEAAFAGYLRRVRRAHFAILVQPYVRAAEHRVFVLEGRALFSYSKHQPSVVGDGRSTLRALAEAVPREHDAPLPTIRARDTAGRAVALEDVPAAGVRITLEGPANRSAGGASGGFRDGAAEPMAQLAVAAAEALSLRLAGVDMFDISGDGRELAVIEVNSNPMIATLEDHNRWDLIADIWRANFAAAMR